MDEQLKKIYNQMLNESQKVEGQHQDMEDAGKMQPKIGGDENVDVDTPEEGLSQEEMKKGGASANKETVVEDSFDFSKSSSFEDLYKSVIGEDADEIVSAPDVEGDDFDDEIGDFEADAEEDYEEETDIATELRTMSERLRELADKYGEPEDEGMDMEDMDDMDDMEDLDDMDEEDEEDEAVTEAKSAPEPAPFSSTPNRSKTASGKLSSVASKKAKGGIKGKYKGEPESLNAKKGHTNTKGNTAKASGPSASKKSTDAFMG